MGKKYVEKLNRLEYEEKRAIIIPYSPTKLIKSNSQKTFNSGYLFLQNIYYRLKLNKICNSISKKYTFTYDLNDILSKLVYTRILYPASKLASHKQAKSFIEQPSFELHDVYRALSILAKESDFIQSELYKNSQEILARKKDVLYYDCTNFYFETEEADGFRNYGKSKENRPLPIVGMGLFMDYDGIPLAFDIYPGNQNEQPTLKPIEKRVLKDYGINNVVICTDAGLSSKANRRFNDVSVCGHQLRSYITTQSIKQLSDYLKEFVLDPQGWHLSGDNKVYNLNEIDESIYYNRIFYKDKWIKENLTGQEIKSGIKPLEQHLIVSFSPKYKSYQRKIRNGQIDRAINLINNGEYKRKTRNQNDPHRFIHHETFTENGEICSKECVFLDDVTIRNEEQYDGFYAVCTNLDDISTEQIIRINKKRWEIEECFRIIKSEFKARPIYVRKENHINAHFITCFISLFIYRILEKQLEGKYTCEEIIDTLQNMIMYRPQEKMRFIPCYTRTILTDKLHEIAGFRTNYEIISDITMKKNIKMSKKYKK